jgi:diaminopimelate epimerase
MGEVKCLALSHMLELTGGPREATLIDAGNPQCALFVYAFDFDWKALGAEIEVHPDFPNRTNVSFVRVVDRATLDVRFFERGAGFTMSSGTGSTGAFAAARARGLAGDAVTVRTLAGDLSLRYDGGVIRMQGPAEIVAGGEYYWT